MKEKSRRIRFALETKLTDIIKILEKEYSSITISDLYIQLNRPQKTLSIYNEEKNFLKDIYLEELLESAENIEFFYENASRLIKEAAINCRNKRLFDLENFSPPLSLIIIDEEGNKLLNFILLNTDRIYVEEKLLKDLDKDLDTFINNLLSDLE